MNARSNILKHPSGIKIETPLMVPSFSSKGFQFKPKNNKTNADISEVDDLYEFSKEFLTECLLLSAYDLYYNHINNSENSIFTEFTLLDSGGYETSGTFDIATTTKYNYAIKRWQLKFYEKIIEKWPDHKAAIIVSYDHGNYRHTIQDQISQAKSLFSKFPNMMNNFLIKPEKKSSKFIELESILPHIKDMNSFNIIGLTERELGKSILIRMLNIHKLRSELDNNGINSPLHIFGSLDPISSILYFLAGAEIFDGLTWLKYSYYNNSAIYQSNYGILNQELGIHTIDNKIRLSAITKNTYYLEKMKMSMKEYLESKSFSVFDQFGGVGFGEIIENSYKTFKSHLK